MSEAVYVLAVKGSPYDPGKAALLKFDTEGDPVPFSGANPYISDNAVTGLTLASCYGCSQLAVDPMTHDIYVTSDNKITAFQANGEAADFTAGPGAGTNVIGGFGELLGVAVDANGNIYASDRPNEQVSVYSHTGEQIVQFPTGADGQGPANLAVDGHGAVYVNYELHPVFKFVPSETPVTASTTYAKASEPVDPNRSLTVTVDPFNNDVYISEFDVPKVAWFDESGSQLAHFAGPGEEGELGPNPEGIGIDEAHEKIFVSNGAEGDASQVEIFWIEPGPPKIKAISATDVTASSATLHARINPLRADTTYHFEYGLGDCSLGGCTSAPGGGTDIGDGAKGVSVSQKLNGLAPETTYHYRVVAENEHGSNLSEEGEHAFTTQPLAASFLLADARGWEMVSPPDKHGALLGSSFVAHVQAAANGEGLVYPSAGPSIEQDPDSNRSFEASTILARRTPDGWQSKDITPPHEEVEAIPLGSQTEYKLFSPDLGIGFFQPRTATRLAPEAAESSPYWRANTEPPSYEPLVREDILPENRELQPGDVRIQAANGDLSHIVFSSAVPLVSGAPPAPASSLYLGVDGQVRPVSVLPPGEGEAVVPTNLAGSGAGSAYNAVSTDGSLIFWSTGAFDWTTSNSITALYVRDVEAEESARLDAVQPGGSGTGESTATFRGASANGDVVFFTDSQQLVEGASPSGADLYRCQIVLANVTDGCATLVDLSAPRSGPGESAEVLGAPFGSSENGSTIYFVARGVLDAASNGYGDSAIAGKPNLYVWREGEGVRFISGLAQADEGVWGGVLGVSLLQTASASPDGRYLAFMSQASLTGEDNLDAATNEPVERVFRYDAAADRLDCVSCDPTGAAPVGETFEERQLVDPRLLWRERLVGATLPEPPVGGVAGRALYSPRGVLNNGRTFFNSIDSLVQADSNREWDVYQYEPIGTGDCTASSRGTAIARTAGGCVSLISSGTGEREAGFLDASVTGDDVFFLTPAKLNETDEDAEMDVYDARVGGHPGTRPSSSECLGEACQPQPLAPHESNPASSEFKGTGNAKPARPCPRGKRKVRRHGKRVCLRTHRRHHSKKTGHNRRAGR